MTGDQAVAGERAACASEATWISNDNAQSRSTPPVTDSALGLHHSLDLPPTEWLLQAKTKRMRDNDDKVDILQIQQQSQSSAPASKFTPH